VIYLAGPINRVALEDAKGWRENVKASLRKTGILVLDPLSVEFGKGVNVVQWDLRAIKGASAVIAHVPDGIQAVGTSMEIFYAASLGIPVYVWGADSPSPWILHFATEVSDSLEGALNALLRDLR
jgi:nucleoside 2-deoxyribosyltransferase